MPSAHTPVISVSCASQRRAWSLTGQGQATDELIRASVLTRHREQGLTTGQLADGPLGSP